MDDQTDKPKMELAKPPTFFRKEEEPNADTAVALSQMGLAELRELNAELLAACKAIDASTAPYRAEDMSPQKTYTVSRNAMILVRTAIAKAEPTP